MADDLSGKKIVIIIAFKSFRDEEYFVPKEILETSGVEVKTASTELGKALGADGGETEVDILIKDLNIAELDAIIFIGGPGALKHLDNEDSYKVAINTLAQNKVLAAICIAPAILAKAGVLEGRRATVWSSSLDRSAINILKKNGAIYESTPVVVDGKIVTANGPAAAKKFTKVIIAVLK